MRKRSGLDNFSIVGREGRVPSAKLLAFRANIFSIWWEELDDRLSG